MIDFVGTSPFLKKSLWVAMATMHFHITVNLWGFFSFAFREYQGTICHQLNIVLGLNIFIHIIIYIVIYKYTVYNTIMMGFRKKGQTT